MSKLEKKLLEDLKDATTYVLETKRELRNNKIESEYIDDVRYNLHSMEGVKEYLENLLGVKND
jgi:hypothetical protein